MKKWMIFFTSILIGSLILTGCGSKTNPQKVETDKNQLEIYTTVYPLQYFSERIGGEFVNVNTLYPPGADEHTFEPSQKDMMKLADSDLFIYIGFGLEGFVKNTEKTLKNENVVMIAAGESIEINKFTEDEHDSDTHEGEIGHESDAHEEEQVVSEGKDEDEDAHDHGDIDPHIWIDPLYATELAEAIKDALIQKMPEKKEQFEENYTQLEKELEELHHEFEETINNAKHKEIIVSHAAYGYWEKRYDLHQISIAGLSSSNEPTQKQLEEIITEANEHDLKYVFFEQNVSSKLTEIVQNELGATPLTLHNLSTRTDEDIQQNKDYFSIMEDNLESLQKALNE